MAKTYAITETSAITIKNNAEEGVNVQSFVGERVVMTLANAKVAGYTDFEYMLDADGNYLIEEGGKIISSVGADGKPKQVTEANIAVTVRQTKVSTDRFIQFYRTQEKLKLAKGDSVKIPVASMAEAAFYLKYADIDGLIVDDSGVATEA